MPYVGTKENVALANTQAAGAFTMDLSEVQSARLHQIQVVVSAAPAAGILTLAIKTPGASGYSTLSKTINLVAGPYTYQIYGFIESIQVTPTGFDGDKTFDVYVASGAAQ